MPPTRLTSLTLCALLACAPCAGPAFCAQSGSAAEQAARQTAAKPATARPAPKAKKPRRAAKADPPRQETPRLTAEELQHPYSAMQDVGNATRLPDFDPAPKSGPFAQPDAQPPVNLRISREKVIDPLTGKEITPRADPAGARESLKGGDLKGAVDKLGGKAEVQVEILKF